MTQAKNVLIIGASGNFGGAVLRALVGRPGCRIRVLVRPGRPPIAEPGVETVFGDGTVRRDLQRATQGMDVVVYGLHAGYVGWRETLLPAARTMADVAAEGGLRVVYPGNVYGLGPDVSVPLDEGCQHIAPTDKGRVRNEIEALFREATTRGARCVIVRSGDFFGPGSRGAWLDFLTRGARSGGAVSTPTRRDVPHAWAYLPDLGATVARLIEREPSLDDFEVFHFRGHELSARRMSLACSKELGVEKLKTVPWWALKVASLVSPLMRELLAMRYLWTTPVLLDDGKLRAFLGDVPHTPLEQALRETFSSKAASTTLEQRAAA